jgi:hypothetical protein
MMGLGWAHFDLSCYDEVEAGIRAGTWILAH